MTEVHIVVETARYNQGSTIMAVMDSRLSADRWVTMYKNAHPDSEAEYVVRGCYTVGSITDEAFNESESFTDIVDAAEWQKGHDMVKDDAYIGSIKRRSTCIICGSSVIQFADGKIKEQGTQDTCPK